jgi:hypothetical protein
MSYEAAINKAWQDLAGLNPPKTLSIKFLADEYAVDCQQRKILSLSCNAKALDFYAILILHYLIKKIKGLPELTGEWLTFREFSGIEGYYDAFKKRAIEPLIKKYGGNPSGILQVLERMPAKKVEGADVAIVLEACEGVPVLIKLWRSDEEFGPDANVLFDRSVIQIFGTEDIVVLAGIIAGQL